jgi:cytoskeletal protein RodZ
MNRRTLFLSFVCALALLLVPASYSWAQSQDAEQQQQPAERQDANPGNQDESVQESERTRTRTTETETESQREASNEADESGEELPATAGELPLLGLLGVLSIAAAVGTRSCARARSIR